MMIRKGLRICLWTMGFALLASLVMLYVCKKIVTKNAQGKTFSDIDSIKYNKVGLLLGTIPRTRIGNRPNPFFAYRIQATVELYKAKKIDLILVSGAEHGPNGFNEPECMKDSLKACGVLEEDIILDGKGYRTILSVINANRVFGLESFTIISQQFHNERALYQAEHLGLNLNGVQAYNAQKPILRNTWIDVREYLARVRMFYDLLLYDENSR